MTSIKTAELDVCLHLVCPYCHEGDHDNYDENEYFDDGEIITCWNCDRNFLVPPRDATEIAAAENAYYFNWGDGGK